MGVFVVDFSCYNCGNEWEREFESRQRVQKSGVTDTKIQVREGTEEAGMHTEKTIETIECPVCELSGTVEIEDRNPLL